MPARIHNCEQGSPEWFAVRLGRLTASEAGQFLLSDDKRSVGARHTLTCKKLAEISGCEMAPNFENWAMARGKELEPKAREAFAYETGLDVWQVGFVCDEQLPIGCSPDGVIGDFEEILEIKCPTPEKHVAHLLEGQFPSEYKFQVHMQLAVTGAKRCHFWSYCPGLPPLHCIVERGPETEELLAGVASWCDEYKAAKVEMAALWDDMRAARKLRSESEEGEAA